ncbi:MAG: hypothetical protein H5U37_07695, partial [Caldisericia bacterium]|nr:hypothetical protein [Caldisericia bacterium]
MSKKLVVLLLIFIFMFIGDITFSKGLPLKPINLKAVQEDYKVRLTWELEKNDDTIQYFEVYRGESEKKLDYIGRTYNKDQMYYLDYSIYL